MMRWVSVVRRQVEIGRWNGMNWINYSTARFLMSYKMSHLFGAIKVCTVVTRFSHFSFFLGALCVYEGIVDSMWNGTSDLSMLKKVGQIYGSSSFSSFALASL